MSKALQMKASFTRSNLANMKRLQALTSATIEAISDAVITVDGNGNIDYVNTEAERLLLKSSRELRGQPFAMAVQIINEHGHQEADNVMAQCFCQKPIYDSAGQLLLLRSDGSSVPIEDFAAPMCLPDGQTVGAVMVFKDVSDRRQAQQTLNHVNQTLHEVLEFAPDALLVANPQGEILFTNNRAEQMFGYRKHQLQGCSLPALITGASSAEELGCNTAEERQCRRADGSEFTGEVSVNRLDTAQGMRLITLIRDITQRKSYEHQLSYQANYDSLTDLQNRSSILAHLPQALLDADANGTKVALMYIDLDHFKTVNQTFGHAVGDRLLRVMASRLQGLSGPSATVASLGGDNFLILLRDVVDKESLSQMATATLQTIAESCEVNNHHFYLCCSIGIAIYPQDGVDAQEILRNADAALYWAKENGRNNYAYFTRDMHRKQLELMELSTGLREALLSEQFELHYQPKLDLKSMTVTSMEALIRWRHPKKGLISPAQFIPVAEDCGLIVEIGAWVIEEACCQLELWRIAGFDNIRVAINLSAVQCHKDDIFARITAALDRYQLPGDCLEVEITESVMLHNPKQALATFRALSEQHVRIAIDDFGTGYSSFSYLKQFPANVLKIDKSFIDDLTEDSGNQEIVHAIISVAHCLNMRVIAEGVETLGQLAILLRHGCDEIQGYLFSRPVPGDNVLDQPWKNQHLPVAALKKAESHSLGTAETRI
ncbi:EAL domain-containing protein [Methylomonas sp. LL1]|uniref:putative bifunctional diguanylate cyclase/phosphodiesterase n=1 Tax=Methylomonas sp. LL1 TaxID=2785785 RepID=UPI0018C40707|nr:bifunctional diguanylate cyclase/phosphodiesterase [Methylomonas sp. LL1]QPK64247.1 EAL domain-containing protein [Methylomonas sp. LL1]